MCVSVLVLPSTIDDLYQSLLSVTVYDRHGIPLSIKENDKGHYVIALDTLPEDFTKLLLKKEDRYFYYHIGVNPLSTLRALFNYIKNGDASGGSTITQQLAKNILRNELDRTVSHKLKETAYAFSIELFYSKEEILIMYANTVYLGNQVQGFETGSYAYFNKPLRATSHSEQLALLATLSYPNARNPWKESNTEFTEDLHQKIAPDLPYLKPIVTTKYSFQDEAYFELSTAGVSCEKSCPTTLMLR
jgi:membrane peptidoglycan carboxypeptidase